MGERRTRSRRRIGGWRGITTVVVVAMAAALLPVFSPPPRAEAAPPIDICNQVLVSGPGGKYLNAQNRIFQIGSPSGAICRLEQQAMATIAARHGQPFDDAEQLRMLSWGRDEVRAELWGQLLRIINSTNRTADEQAAYDWLQTRLRQMKLQMAQSAKSEYDRWHNNPCAYVAPAAPSYRPNCADGTLLQLFTGPPAPPGYDDFVAYGASMTLADYQTDQAARVAANTARLFSHLATFSAAFGITTAVGLAGLGLAIALGATLGTIFPFAAAGFTAGAVGVAGAFVFVVLMAVVAIVRGIQVFEDAKIPERLDQDVVDAGVPPNLVDQLDSASELNLMYTAFLSGTLPDYPNPSFKPAAPTAPGPGSQNFMLVSDGTYQWVNQFTYVGPDGLTNTVWLDHGWFVIDPGDGSPNVMTHELQFLTGPGQGVKSAMITPTGKEFQVFDASTLDSKYPCTAPACTTESRLTMLKPGTTATSQRVYLMANPLTISAGPTVTGDLTQHSTVTLSATATSTFASLGPITYRWRLTHASTAVSGQVVEQFLDGQNPTFVLPQPGAYGVTVTATDATGASASASTSFNAGAAVAQLTIQQGPPSGSNPLGIGPYWYEGTAGTLSVTATEPGTFSVSFDEDHSYDVNGYGPGLDNIVIDAPTYPNEGYHPVHVHFVSDDGDVVDQAAYLEVRNARPDNPELQVEVAGNWEYLNDPSVDLSFNEGDTLHVRYQVYDRGLTDDLTVTLTWPDTGDEVLTHVTPGVWHEVTHHLGDQSSFGPGVAARVVDDALSASGITEAFFSVMNVTPTISNVVATVDGDGVATLSARYGDAVPEVGRAEINWGDGTPVETVALPMSLVVDDGALDETDATFPLSPDELRATHPYAAMGLYDVTVTVFDDTTSTSATVRVPFINMRPRIDDLTMIEVQPYLNLVLEAELSDPDGFEPPSALVLHVDWGDGTTSDVGWDPATGTHPTNHTYPSVGTYTVVLTAADGRGAVSKEARGTVQIVDIAPPLLVATPSPSDAGTVEVGTTGASQVITVTNDGEWPAVLGAVSVGGTDANRFAAGADTCSGATLAVDATCTVAVSFSPTAAGSATASLDIAYDGPVAPLHVPLAGTGAVVVPPTISPSPVSFGDVAVGHPVSRSVTLTNDGLLPVSVSGAALADGTQGFAITNDGCGAQVLAPAGTCVVQVAFDPATEGARTDTLTVGGTPGASVNLSANGVAPGSLGSDPDTIDFPVVEVGKTGAPTAVTVTNEGGYPVVIAAVGLGGTHPTAFTLGTDTCTAATLPAGATCSVEVSSSPSVAGPTSATLEIAHDGDGTPLVIAITGRGAIAQAPTITPSGVDLGDVAAGTHVTSVVTVTNDTDLDVPLGDVTIGAAGPPSQVSGASRSRGRAAPAPAAQGATAVEGFTVDQDGCSGLSLAAGASCQVVVGFTSPGPGPHRALLLVGGGLAASVSLQANGLAPPTTSTTTTSTLSTTTSTTTPTVDPTTSPAAVSGAGSGSGGGGAGNQATATTGTLPATGSDTTRLVWLAALLLLTGAALLTLRRRLEH